MRAFASAGRRLGDGARVDGPRPVTGSLAAAAGAALIALAVATCPSHDGFEAFLTSAAAHPSGFLGSVSALIGSLRIAVGSSSNSYLILRTGAHRGARFVGAFGTWVVLPRLPSMRMPSMRMPTSLVAAACSRDSPPPHESFALLCVAGIAVCWLAPRVAWRHGVCSLGAVRAGRPWVMLTANVAHFSAVHLAHNLLTILHLGPLVHAALGCERALCLLLASGLAASAASVLWHAALSRRDGSFHQDEGSVGASGVAIGLAAANAVLYPRTGVRMYGADLSAGQQLVLYLALDALAARGGAGGSSVDVSAHVGGAIAGYALASRWGTPWPW